MILMNGEETSNLFQEEILEEGKFVFDEKQEVNQDKNMRMSQWMLIVNDCKLEIFFYAKSFILKGGLSAKPDLQATASFQEHLVLS